MAQSTITVSRVHATMDEPHSRLNSDTPCILLTYSNVADREQRTVDELLRQWHGRALIEQNRREGVTVVCLDDDRAGMRADRFRSIVLGTLRQIIEDWRLGIAIRS